MNNPYWESMYYSLVVIMADITVRLPSINFLARRSATWRRKIAVGYKTVPDQMERKAGRPHPQWLLQKLRIVLLSFCFISVVLVEGVVQLNPSNSQLIIPGVQSSGPAGMYIPLRES